MGEKKEEAVPILETNEPVTSMPVLDEETLREDGVERREDSGEMAEVDMERITESPPEARHRLPLLVAPRESTPSLRRPLPPRPLLLRAQTFQPLQSKSFLGKKYYMHV